MYAPWAVAALLLVSVVGYAVGRSRGGDATSVASPEASSGAEAPFASGTPVAAPDISKMTPIERASRLYDRVMRYVEEGKKDSAQFFAPMALASYEALGAEIDLDGRYDYGRVAQETGNMDIAAAQADTILQRSATHLLGLILSARIAAARGDQPVAVEKAWKTFLASKDGELKKKLPEYEMHATDIDRAARLAAGGK